MTLLTASILGLGDTPSAFGQTLALLITFVGVGLIVNVLIVYIIAQVVGEHKQNRERRRSID